MSARTRLTLSQVCEYFRVDIEVVRDFADFGLYPTIATDGEIGIDTENLDKLWEIISLHRALGINKEGIEVILELREKISALQDEVESLRNEVEKLKGHLGSEDPETLKRLGLLIEIGD
jgi:uncharacterized small protein (DUF1192 family)